MTEFFTAFIGWWRSLFDLLDSITFELYGFNVSFLSVLFVFLLFAIVISVFWKGAKA